MRLIWQAILASCILRFSFASVQKDVEEPICTDFMCTRHSLKTETRTFVDDVEGGDGRQIECKSCEICTNSGYSVCLKAKQSDDKCMCSQEIPRGCSVLSRTSPKPVPEQQQMNICYSSSLRNPPKPSVVNEPNNDLIATIDQFWLQTYWKNMKLENLTIYYEFPIHSPHLCDGLITTVKRPSGEGIGYLCTPMLRIELEEETPDSKDSADESISHNDYDNNLPPEIQFERAVFDGAPYVRFYYKIQVRRERQLGVENGLVEKLTTLTSDVLTYDLDASSQKSTTSQVIKTTTQRITQKTTTVSSTTITTQRPTLSTRPVNKVNIEQRTQTPKSVIKEEKKAKSQSKSENGQGKEGKKDKSFLNEHLNNGGQFQLIICGIVITAGICLLVIVVTLLYRRHAGNVKRSSAKVPVTKQMNGYEYRATVQDEK